MRSRPAIWIGAAVLPVAALLVPACQSSGGARASAATLSFHDGQLQRPEGYREWIFVGEPVTPNDMNGGKAPFPEFHSVYIDPVSYRHYADTGEFRDGTILVKELVSVGSKEAVSGRGYFMGDFIGLEATVKSAKHFPNEPGNWAYFSFTNPGGPLKSSAEPFPTASCNACHETNAADDFVFTQYYPVLRAAKGERTAMATTSDQWSPTATTPTRRVAGVPLGQAELFDYLTSHDYRAFPASESTTHPGRGPHSAPGKPVRVYYNEVLANSFAAGNDTHPKGAVAIKEMFDDDDRLDGWAVMAKTGADSDDGRGWFWYEVTSTTDSNAVAAIGNGVPGCNGCHSVLDTDLIVSGYPLR